MIELVAISFSLRDQIASKLAVYEHIAPRKLFKGAVG